MTWTCHECGNVVHGYKAEHCTVCHETFSGTSAGDKHRVGEHGVSEGPDRRRCLTVAEMRDYRAPKGSPRRFWYDPQRDEWSFAAERPQPKKAPPRPEARKIPAQRDAGVPEPTPQPENAPDLRDSP